VISSGSHPLCSYATAISFTRMPVPSMVGEPSLCSGSRTMLVDGSSHLTCNQSVVGNKLTCASVDRGHNPTPAETLSTVKNSGLGTLTFYHRDSARHITY
jgi:hypothetical protein